MHNFKTEAFAKAYAELEEDGCPVYIHPDNVNTGRFDIEPRPGWADYYDGPQDLPWVCRGVEEILAKHGLHAEWEHAGRLDVYES